MAVPVDVGPSSGAGTCASVRIEYARVASSRVANGDAVRISSRVTGYVRSCVVSLGGVDMMLKSESKTIDAMGVTNQTASFVPTETGTYTMSCHTSSCLAPDSPDAARVSFALTVDKPM
jgi:hypothetical protein